MAFGQTALVTTSVHGLTRGITAMAMRCLGKSPVEAQLIASEVSVKVAAAAASTVAVVTLDPIGGALSAGYLGLAMGDTNATVEDLKKAAQARAKRSTP